MIRDFDLIRRILLDVEGFPANSPSMILSYPDEYDQDVVNEHLCLLIEADLIHGKPLRAMDGIVQVTVRGLTWAGHDFIDASKDKAIWEKAKTLIKEKGGAITFEVLKSLLTRFVGEGLGLP